MKEEFRHKQIIRMISEEKMVQTSALMKLFGVSMETVRRDFSKLEEKGVLRRVYGGAVFDSLRSSEIAFTHRERKNIAEKRAIGKEAAALVNDGETIVMNSGSTIMEVAYHLLDKKDLTIITNCFHTAFALQNNETARIFFIGGELRKNEMSTSGHLGNEFLARFRADKAILGVGGIDSESGVTDYHCEESYIWHDMIRISGKTIIVADYSKFGVSALNQVCNLSNINYLVTDWNTSLREVNKYRKYGIQVIAAQKIQE